MQDSQISTLGSSIETAELTDGNVTTAKLHADTQALITNRSYWSSMASDYNTTNTTPTHTNTSSQRWYYHLHTPNQNDELTYEVFLKAGTYKLQIYGVQSGDGGIITVYLDAASQGTLDQYNGGANYNHQGEVTLTPASDGFYTLKLAAETKNSSSSGYLMRLTRLWITD